MKTAFIEISGPDASTYLQGQVSCDVQQTSNQAILGCLCNTQGRIQILFRLFKLKNNFILAFPAELNEKCLARLRKYSIFSKVKIEEVTPKFKPIYLPNIADLDKAPPYFKVSDSLYEVYLTAENKRNSELSEQAFHLGKINAGIPEIYAATYETFLPHDLSLDKLGALSFEKGCYTGQEIIARMHYRGKLKQHMQQLQLENKERLTPGEELKNTDGKLIGRVIDSAMESSTQQLLALLRDEYNLS